jgi:hypothetical protein
VLARSDEMRVHNGWSMCRELACGPYLIVYSALGFWGPRRGANLQIWPGSEPGLEDFGVFHGNKVASADWWQDDSVKIITYRSGAWEGELLSLLRDGSNVTDFKWHRRRKLGLHYL